MSNRRNNNYTTSSSSSPSSDFTSKKNNINDETKDESDTFTRPLSLYDNLNALVASLKPPGINENNFLENYNKNIINNNNSNSANNINNNKIRGATVNRINNNHNSSDVLFNVNQEDFIFSDIKFNFPKIPNTGGATINDNDHRMVNLKNGGKNMIASNSNNHHNHHHHNNNHNNNNYIQYDNSDGTVVVGNKPVHSDAKSSFFGLNNNIHNSRNNCNNNDTQPIIASQQQQQLQSMPNGVGDHNDDNDDDDDTLITITNVQSTTINIQKRKNVNSNEDDGGGGCDNTADDDNDDDDDDGDNNNNNNIGDDSHECDEEKNFLNPSESQQKQVTYITPDKYGYDNKPSQAVYMTTTVPQNIKGNNIMGRHTPTRNSLRHSRMLVVNKHFQGGFEKSNPMNLQCPGLLRLLLIIALLSGILLTSIALWIQIWAPNTRIQDKPYWSGIVLILCSIISLKLLNFKRAGARNSFRKICFKVLIINSIIFSSAAAILTILGFVFAFIHFKNLWYVDNHCFPSKLFAESSECMCIFGVAESYGDHMKIKNPENLQLPVGGYTFNYKDLSCSEVRDVWRYIVLASLIINLLGFLAVVCYLFIFFFKTKKQKQPNITVNRMSSINIT